MLPPFSLLRSQLREIIAAKAEQGHAVKGLEKELAGLPDSYDALWKFARRVAALPLRDGWPYREPDNLQEIWAECDPARPPDPVGDLGSAEAAARVEAAFLGRVCGCILGKPLEVNPTLDEISRALQAADAWPLHDYVTERTLRRLGRRHPSWETTVRDRITCVTPDDDLNYTILGMLILEKHGIYFTRDHVRDAWLRNLPVLWTHGPERLMLLRAGQHSLTTGEPPEYGEWVGVLNPKEECCGALIRVDAYAYACAGRPALAAELAWRDASWTHRRTGIYGAMFAAAAIAVAPVTKDPLAVFETALQFVPRRSRFHEIVTDCLAEVRAASDWVDGYDRIHRKYKPYGHCRVYQECGTLINTLRFAQSVGSGLCKQVTQGNDTDSFGATAGSILGAFFGPAGLDARWLRPFQDDLRTTLAEFTERSLAAVAKRMAGLPARVAEDLARGGAGLP
jgi:ADP-ribosylglycohydrolase